MEIKHRYTRESPLSVCTLGVHNMHTRTTRRIMEETRRDDGEVVGAAAPLGRGIYEIIISWTSPFPSNRVEEENVWVLLLKSVD